MPECGVCHKALRIKARYCLDCQPRPEVRCRGYETASGARVHCGRVVVEGVGDAGFALGQCVTCGEWQRKAWEQRRVREGRKLLRDRAKGYGRQPGDPFKGMREGD